MKKLVLGSALAVLSMAVPAAAQAQQLPQAVIAVVDSSRIYEQCTACVAANQQLQAQMQQIQQRAQQLGTPLQTEAQSLEQAFTAAQGNPDAALQQRIQTFQTQSEAAQREIQQREEGWRRNVAFVRQQIDTRMDQIVVQVMQQRGATVAMDSAVVRAHSPALDVTDAVLAALNQQLPSVNVNAPPPQQQPAAQQPAQPQQQQRRPGGR